MIYETPAAHDSLMQGDLINGCPVVFFRDEGAAASPILQQTVANVVVLTQSCDLAQIKAERVLVGVVHRVQLLVENKALKPTTIREQIRNHKVYGWYFLPAGPGIEESIVDLRDLHTIPRALRTTLIQQGQRCARIATPYREHLAQHFAVTYSRIGLPEPYATQPEA